MGESHFDQYDSENTLVDEETWNIILGPALRNEPGVGETIGRLLFYLKEAIESGPEGAARAVNTLMQGIDRVYPYTTAFALSNKLWILSLEGDLVPMDEPEPIVEAALERGWKNTVKGRKRRAARQCKRAKQ